MENTPINLDTKSEVSDKPDKKDSKKKKKAVKLGSFVVAPEKKSKPEDQKPPSLFNIESSSKDSKSKAEKKAENAPIDELSNEEKQFVEREYVQANRQENLNDEPQTPEDIIADSAVEDFRSKIEEGLDSDEALEATLHDIQNVEDASVGGENKDDEPRETRVSKIARMILPSKEAVEDDGPGDETNDDGRRGNGRPPIPGTFDFMPHPEEPNGRPSAPNALPNTENPKSQVQEKQYATNPAPAALLGGILGYLIGKRKGRINTEKKLLPIQKKLQKEVIILGQELTQKEQIIRQAARAKAYEFRSQEFVIPRQEKPVVSKQVSRERLGHMVVTHESVRTVEPKKIKPKEEVPKITKHVENLKRVELLELSRKIIVEGSSLRQIYDSHLIGERGLRRLVAEHLRGGNLKKALKRELIEKEIDFERDPNLRDHHYSHFSASQAKPTNLNALIAKASASLPATSDSNLSFAPSKQGQKPTAKKHISKQHAADTMMLGTIFILVVIILILLLKQG